MDPLIKKRKFRIQPSSDDLNSDLLVSALRKLKGINAVSMLDQNRLLISYDLVKCNGLRIEELINGMGWSLYPGFLGWVYRGWIHFIEENEYNAAKSSAGSCHGGG